MTADTPKTPSKSVTEGQAVRFIPRDANLEARVVPYYDFYATLTGTVAKVYDDGAIAVIVDRTTLPIDALERHEKSERDMRDKWIRSLSEEDRIKLTDQQKQFNLRYTLLVSATDLIDIDATAPTVPEKPAARKTSPVPTRPTEEAIAVAEAAHLEELKRSGDQH